MAPVTVLDLLAPVSACQCMPTSNTSGAREKALHNTSNFSSSAFLSACHEFLIMELSTLSLHILGVASIHPVDFSEPAAFFTLPDGHYHHNPVVLRPALEFHSPTLSCLVAGVTLSFTISRSSLTFVSQVVEAYRLTLWIGAPMQVHYHQVITDLFDNASFPRSQVFVYLMLGLMDAYNRRISDFTTITMNTSFLTDLSVLFSGFPPAAPVYNMDSGTLILIHADSVGVCILSAGVMRHVKLLMFPCSQVLTSILAVDTITPNTVGFEALVGSISGMAISQLLKWSHVVVVVAEGVLIRLWHGGPWASSTEGLDHASHNCISPSALNLSNSRADKKVEQEATNIRISVNKSDAPGAEKLWKISPRHSIISSKVPERQLKAVDHGSGKGLERLIKARSCNLIKSTAEPENKCGFVTLVSSIDRAFKANAHGFNTTNSKQRINHGMLEDTHYISPTPTCGPRMSACYVGVTTCSRLQHVRNEIDVYNRTCKHALGDISYVYALYPNIPSMVIDTASSILGFDQDLPELRVGVKIFSGSDDPFLYPYKGQRKALYSYLRLAGVRVSVVRYSFDMVSKIGDVVDVIGAIRVSLSTPTRSATHPLALARNKPFIHVFETIGICTCCIHVLESQARVGSQVNDLREVQSIGSVMIRNCHVQLLHIPLKTHFSHTEAVSSSVNVLFVDRDRTISLVIPPKNPNHHITDSACDNIATAVQGGWVPFEKPQYALLLTPRVVIGFQLHDIPTRVPYINFPTYPSTRGNTRVPLGEDTLTAPPPHRVLPCLPMADPHILRTWSQHPTQANSYVAVFETPINQPALAIQGHRHCGIPPCSVSVFIEHIFTVLELVRQLLPSSSPGSHAILRKIELTQPLAHGERVSRTIVTNLNAHSGSGTFSIISRVNGSVEESVHMHGEYKVEPILKTSTKFCRTLPVINRRISAVTQSKPRKAPQRFSTRTIYEVIFPRVIDYAKEYRTIRSLVVDPSGMEGFASVQLPASHDRSKSVVCPVFTETLFQVASFMANIQEGPDGTAYVLSGVGSFKVIQEQVNTDASYNVYCNMWRLPDQDVVLANVYARTPSEPPTLIAQVKDMHFRHVCPDSLKNPSHTVTKTPQQTSYTPPAPVFLRGPSSVRMSPSFAPRPSPIFAEVETFEHTPLFPDPPLYSHHLSRHESTTEFLNGIPHSSPSRNMTKPQHGIFSPRTLVPEEHLSEPTLLPVYGQEDLDNSSGVAGDADMAIDSLTSGEAVATPSRCLSSNDPTTRRIQSYFSCHLPNEPSSKSLEVSVHGTRCYRCEDPSSVVPPDSANRLTRALKLDTVPLSLQNSDSKTLPLFLIHDGSGLVNYYHGIISLGRRVWGFTNPKFITSEPWSGITEMAFVYAGHISRISAGPVIVGGWSFGGVVAYETSKQLAMRGVQTQGILVIDSPSPIHHIPLSNGIIDSVVNLNARRPNSDLARLIKTQFIMNSHLLGGYDPRATGGACPPLVFLRSSEGFNPPGVSDVPLWLSDRSDPKISTAGWEEIASGPVEVLDIPGHHFTPFHPTNIKSVAERMIEGCMFLENA
ncbi:hypothetical protein P691DRAFT_735510 [Macrolepiota fuliginosa MF-IS2]|uniref:PKS/mFAS DH domain-containing protein n=1 Tax=Macrolepiota fuliginosa MF-IS2 TaxID=1400762 RepID=A0A9P6C0Y9_9AGAR|nr:hypothetical protein P691DRAFT_735510 [Macrolepiota fuliginosa MF-IS2]